MARLLWLATVLRAAGLTVHEVPGWKTRGADKLGTIVGGTLHATAGSRLATTQGEINVLINGSTSAPPPIAQCLVERGTGDWYVCASGLCFHSLTGWAGPNEGYGNPNLIGVEAMNDNRGEPWAPKMLDSYQRGVAAISRGCGTYRGRAIPATRWAAHWEHQPGRKTDPVGINIPAFRARVAQLIANPTPPPKEEDDMFPTAIRTPSADQVKASPPVTARTYSEAEYDDLIGFDLSRGDVTMRTVLAMNDRLNTLTAQVGALIGAANDTVKRDAAERERELADDAADAERDAAELAELRALRAEVAAVDPGDADALRDLVARIRVTVSDE